MSNDVVVSGQIFDGSSVSAPRICVDNDMTFIREVLHRDFKSHTSSRVRGTCAPCGTAWGFNMTYSVPSLPLPVYILYLQVASK
jgi:hypothetical protein